MTGTQKVPGSLITTLAREKKRPDESEYLSLSHEAETEVCTQTGLTRKQVQIHALEIGVTPERYARNQNYLSMSDQVLLLNSHIGVTGLGGLGGAVTEMLSRVGVGSLTLVDGDVFDESNLNRQLLSSTDNLGKAKAYVAAERVKTVNPAIETKPVEAYLTEENGREIMEGCRLVIDCLDTINARFDLEGVCRTLNVPLISGAIGGTAGQVITIQPGVSMFEKIYGPRRSSPDRGIEAKLGTVVYGAISVAALLCMETVSMVTGKGPRFVNKLVLADYSLPSLDIADLS